MVKEKEYNYQKAIEIITSQEKFHIKLGLERVSDLLRLLGNPQKQLNVIHVAGTNGKGSTCVMLASVLEKSGYKTGLYTSPHLIEYTERLKINGMAIEKEDFARILFKIIDISTQHNIPVTEFEILTVMAFEFFKEQNVDFVILETGLGGRLDATNVVKEPVLTIITSIDFDHIDRLGNTIEKIAYEKSGIIKKNIPVITLKNNNGVDVIKNAASTKSSELFLADKLNLKENEFNTYVLNNQMYTIPLLGKWQGENLALVLKAVEILRNKEINIPESALTNGLNNVKWPGRFQYLKDKNIILDGAHNLSAARLLRESLDEYFPDQKRIWIYSSLSTKDYNSIIQALFKGDDLVITTKSHSLSAVSPAILKESILKQNNVSAIYEEEKLDCAINLAKSIKISDRLIIIAGSLYTVGEALSFINSNC